MKKIALLVSTSTVFLVSSCSMNSQKTASNSAPAAVQASAAPARTSPHEEPPVPLPATLPAPLPAPLPALTSGRANPQAWRSETIKDGLSNAVELKETSLDGKFD